MEDDRSRLRYENLAAHCDDALEQLSRVWIAVKANSTRIDTMTARLDTMEQDDRIEREVTERLKAMRRARYTTGEKIFGTLVAVAALGDTVLRIVHSVG